MSGASVPGPPDAAGSIPDGGFRLALWRGHGASEAEARELVAYGASPLHGEALPSLAYPLPDAACVEAWERYAAEARERGAFAVLREVLVQLRFPVATGTSQDPAYQAASRRGVVPDGERPGLRLVRPQGLRLFLHHTPAGRVPVVVAEAREDFEALVQAVVHRNEPQPVPPSMGACMVAGYNNWDRVAQRRRRFHADHPEDWTGEGWATAFRELIPRKDLYQDRFMLLSSGPYSSIPAEAVGLPEADWREASLRLRLEHECTHYFMRQAFGVMRKSLLDELVADYMGLVEATGSFRADRFLCFMGLEAFPDYREGGRLQNYRGDPPLSDGAFAVLHPIVKRAAENLERLDPSRRGGRLGMVEKASTIVALTRVGLEGLASDDARRFLASALDEAAVSVRGASSLSSVLAG